MVPSPSPLNSRTYSSDYNFRREGNKCVLIGTEPILSGSCDAPGDKYTTSSGYRKIPGNTCIEPSSDRKDSPIEKTCGEEGAKNPNQPTTPGEINHYEHDFPGGFIQYIYLERSETSSGDDETILMHVGQSSLFISHDGGRGWDPILEGETVGAVYANPHFKDWVYFVTSNQKVYYTRNRGKDVSLFEGPPELPISTLPLNRLAFHPKHAGWIIWMGERGCDGESNADCHTFAQYTKNAGETWHDLARYVKECVWVSGIKNDAPESLIYCSQYEDQKGDQRSKDTDLTQLISSADFFDNSQVKFRRVIGFANLDEYLVVAYLDSDDKSLKMSVTVDGEIFANADFPPQFATTRQTAYTVLDSATKSIFLHVTTNDVSGKEFGTLMKSNSNGTYYVTSEDAVNRDIHGYVDFEKVQGLEGVAMVNVVVNVDEVKRSNEPKKLRTKVTHNDGGQWFFLKPPERDSEGKAYDCKGGLDKCSLNLHGYTERRDVRDTYSSGSAVGVLLGVGNVGDSLLSFSEANTFISDDAGVTWREVHKGSYTWEFGDQGGIIVVVRDDQPTDTVLWSEDQGRTWEPYKFSDRPMSIEDIATVPSDTSRKFMMIANPGDTVDRVIIQLDFTGLHDQKCTNPFDSLSRMAG
jgi:Sortilin, neurotensin receptor 3,/Sortilin, neurotensin receptor 3, C-terminal